MTIERPSIFWAGAVSLALVSSVVCVAQPAPATVIGKFAGTWKENETKRKLGSAPGLRFRKTANGQLEELRGPEARPLVQPVHFDGKPYSIDNSKNMIAWKQNDAKSFERTLSESGNLLTHRRIRISDDGKTLTEVTERKVSGGKDLTTTMVFTRSAGDAQGLAGTWKPQSMRTSQPAQVKYEALGTNGLRGTGRLGLIQTLMFDGKPTPVTGPAVISGTMVAAKLINDSTIETTASREGVVTGKSTLVISGGGKTLTITSTNVGPNAGGEASVSVFEKQ